ncbi:hypothetical protein SS50377_20459 [Spironucleus salmonicida]|uniref:Uncharacterized protein n=1 Tax=Spironucleus salmonicida TaxID=348837 RepID=V6LXR8_9EUKA|nr:hypothetical protein SS50377_20459 [Spironucleus salmonicida]|eukprot:EST45609.1 Hypothetical protein SS50377_14463 [Spironucleus salmonicida]
MDLFTKCCIQLPEIDEHGEQPTSILNSKSFIRPTQLLTYEEMSEISSVFRSNFETVSDASDDDSERLSTVLPGPAKSQENVFHMFFTHSQD